MASLENTLKRTHATRRKASRSRSTALDLDDEEQPSPRPVRRAKFGPSTFIQDSQNLDNEFESIADLEAENNLVQPDHSEEESYRSKSWCFLLCRIQVESKTLCLLFRICAVINILSLMFSNPLFGCNRSSAMSEVETSRPLPLGAPLPANASRRVQNCYNVFVQYTVITLVDFALAVFYTLQTLARIEYAIYIRRSKQSKPLEAPEIKFTPDNSPVMGKSYGSILRLVNLVIITLTIWYSVGIGVFRTYTVATNHQDPKIHWAYYWCFALRLLSIFTAVKLVKYLALIKSSNFREFLENIKVVLDNLKKNTKRWSQLVVVTCFYLFFIYLFALFGVQWIGGLDTVCIHSSDGKISIPVSHCTNNTDQVERTCYNDSNFVCSYVDEKDSNPLRIDKRNEVYLGQFRSILDAMFGVYEASSWELWIFMWYSAFDGAPRNPFFISVFYFLLFAFLVIFIQQSIFLVVIVESFADFRVETSSDSSKPVAKPAIVLSEQQGQSSELHLTLVKKESSSVFQRKFNKYYYSWWRWFGIETLFISLVVVDSIVFASKHSNMPQALGYFLYYWQIVVSIIFVVEIGGILAVHIFYRQPRLFLESKYFWYLTIIAIGGLVSAAVYRPMDPVHAGNAVVIFQTARLFRVMRLPLISRFSKRVFGNGSRLLVVTITVLVFLGCFSIIAVQIFGYLDAEPECERTGSDQFSNFFIGFQSMFQLVMQEGWTELMGEVMCYRDTWWIFINAIFIILHLFGSLILLNFFVAVILDNLEYDDETKKQKLEEDLKKQKVEKVPRDLKIFKLFGQKTISGPKIPSIDVPNLTEADVRNFYNVGEVTEFSASFKPEHPDIVADIPSLKRRSNSALSDIELLTDDKNELLQSGVPSQHGWYYGVQGILNYVKAFRQHSQAVEGNRRGQPLSPKSTVEGVGRQTDSSLHGQSEYDEYREKYRLFDSALFCLPPNHRFRKACKKILTFRVHSPETYPGDTPVSSWRHLPWKWVSYVLYFIRLILSSVPVFYWIVYLVTIATLCIQAYELFTGIGVSNPSYIWISDLVFVLVTLTELMLKVIVNGLIFNPNGALRSLWGVLDWLILLATLTVMIIYRSVCENEPMLTVTFNPALVEWWIQALLFVRALRPLRFISLLPSMRRVLLDIGEGWRTFVRALFLFCLFLFMFANLGVQLFAGKDSPQEFCNDPNVNNSNDCQGEFEIFIDISPHDRIPTDKIAQSILVPRVWYSFRRDFQFDNIGVAMLTLFQMLTTEGWPQVRNLFGSDPFARQTSQSWVMSLYIHVFIFFGVNVVLQVFVGIVVNNYNEHKPNHSALLTVSQKRWSDLVQRISLTRPIKKPPEPRNNRLRLFLYRVFSHPWYRNVSTCAVFLNSAVLWIPWSDDEMLVSSTRALIYVSIAFSLIFLLELVLEFIAFGLNYFNIGRNVYEFFVALFSVCYIVLALYYINAQPKTVNLQHVTNIALLLALFRLFTVQLKYRVFQNLLETVVKTVYQSLALLGVLAMTITMYSFVGMLFFRDVRSGEAVDFGHVNFDGVLVSMQLVVRTITGEDWFQILWDTMVGEPYCSKLFGDCGNVTVALIWFVSFYIFVSFFLINMIIAVLLENFSIFYEDDDTELNRSVVKDFKQNWFYFDKKATGKISSSRIKLFLRMLKIKDFFTYRINENGVKERQKSDIMSDSLLLREMAEELQRDHRQHGSKGDEARGSGLQLLEVEPNKESHSFQNVLRMVAYRSEDISKRLVPHELYVREELEQSVQFDVAEDCIFKWMQRYVKPVISRQEKHRRQTVAQLPRQFANKEHSVIFEPLLLNVQADVLSDTQSVDSDDYDADPLATGVVLSSRPTLQVVGSPQSDEEIEFDDTHDASEKERNLARSYAKLAQMGPPVDTGKRDKWHDWIRMQSEWMDKVETDPDNYFDDYL